MAERTRRRRSISLLTALSFVVTGGVAWQLRCIGTAMTSDPDVAAMTCGDDTADSTVRSDECYEVISDTGDSALPGIPDELTGSWREKMAAIAVSQIGYDCGGALSGYSAWYGSNSIDWNTVFVLWCMNRAGVEGVPTNAGCWAWNVSLETVGMLQDTENGSPAPGDVVFLDSDDDGKADRCAVITSNTPDGGFIAVEGDHEGKTAEVLLLPGDRRICSFLALEQPEIPTTEPVTDDLPAETTKQAADAVPFTFSGVTENGVQVQAQAPAEAFPEDTEMVVADISEDDAFAAAYEHFGEDASLYDAVAVDISFITSEGVKIEPELDVQVSLTLPEEMTLQGSEMSLIHLSDEGVTETVDAAQLTSEGAEFTAESFSVYVMTSWGEKEADTANNMFQNGDNTATNPYILRVGEVLEVSVDASDKNGRITVKNNDISASQRHIDRTSDGTDNYDTPGRVSAKFMGKNPGDCYVAYLADKGNWNSETDQFYVKVVYPIYMQTAQGEIDKDRLHEYLKEAPLSDGGNPEYICDESGRKLYWKNNSADGGKYMMYDGDEITVVTYAPVEDDVSFVGDNNIQLQGDVTTEDVGNGLKRVSAVFKGVMPYGEKGNATITLVKDGADPVQYFRCFVIHDGRDCTHADIEIADGGSYVERKYIENADGTSKEIVTVYDAYVDNVNHCYIYNKDGSIIQDFETEHYYRGGNPGETQYELTSNYIKAEDGASGSILLENGDYVYTRGDKLFKIAEADTALFDVQLLLKPRTQTTTYYTGETVTNVTVEDITEQDDVLLKSVEFNMNHTSVIDAYNKCPNHSGLDFTITADLNSVAAAVKLDAQKEFVNGTLAGDDFDFQLYDLQAPVKLYFAKGDADMHIADPDNGNLVRVYQLNIPSQSSWGEGIDGWKFYNALVERYSWNDATSGLIQSPGDVGDLFEGYLNGDDMSPHMSEEQLKKLIYSFAVQDKAIVPVDGNATVQDGICLVAEFAPAETQKNDKNGKVLFGDQLITKPGTYNYIVKEVKGSDDTVQYDTHEELVSVTAVFNEESEDISSKVEFSYKRTGISDSGEYTLSDSDSTTFTNYKRFVLPATGGMGVIPFVLAGSGMITAAFVLTIKRRRDN
ncbi:MAG: LPXTG cell wall anchor domain-containing protein [Ruminococcus sp.]|nr:LPXTG cell wall anchor domain-containing protein [Ruminococcus sp.]